MKLLSILALSGAAFGQIVTHGLTGLGTVDNTAAPHTIPLKTGVAASKPATCTVGEMYFATDATAGQNIYDCTATNTWTQQAGGGGGGASFPACHAYTGSSAVDFSAFTCAIVTAASVNPTLTFVAPSGSAATPLTLVLCNDSAPRTWTLPGTAKQFGTPALANSCMYNGGITYDGTNFQAPGLSEAPSIIRLQVERAAPIAPPLGQAALWPDSTNHVIQAYENNTTTRQTMVVTDSGPTAGQCIDSIPASGIPHKTNCSGSGGGASAGAVNAVQASNGTTAFLDTGCTAVGAAMSCAGGFSGGANFTAGGSEIATPTTPAINTIFFSSTNHLPQYTKAGSSAIDATMAIPTTCTNQVLTGITNGGLPVCTTITSAYLPAASSAVFASGATSLGTGAIASASHRVVTVGVAGITTTDIIAATANGALTGITGYVPSTGGMLGIYAYPTAGAVNFDIFNNTAGSITPGNVVVNWKVIR